MGKVARDSTLQEVNARLGEIRDVLSLRSGTILGFRIDGTESDPEAAVTYVADAVGMTPAAMDFTNGVFNYGSWGNAFFLPRPCMLKYDGTVDYYLNPNDYSKKYGGGDSDVANDAYGGNAMMEWGQNGKKIWYKIMPDADPTSATVYIADYQADADFRAWSFINSAGQMKEHFYTPIYNGWSDGSSRMRSISGKTPTASLDAQTERDRCRANNSSLAIWDTEVFADNILITLLLILMGKNLNTQAVFGQGCATPGEAGVLNTGTGDALGLFYGYSDTTKVVKVFGMENFWGNLWRRFGGLVNDNGTCRYKLTRGTQDGSGASDYVISAASADYAAYHQGGAIPAASGSFVSRMLFNMYMFAPYAVGSNAAHHYCDAFWGNNAQVNYACRGGVASFGSSCGAWCLYLYDLASAVVWAIAAAPSCKPL